ncbi:recombinase family protein [Acutalibacter intestini]|uniref:recombinase family protein n=1 Tax=Acutalibacter intestini TaxID=3093659 RepID=UPI002AC92B6C|nr:recombinase family protein [Acutalibacter sp. M00204]
MDVYYEEQNIHSMSTDGKLMLTILASYAQEESLSASENQKWRIKKNFEDGKPWSGQILRYRYENGVYIVKPDEAEIVREIFADYLSGMGVEAIMKKLNAEGRTTRNGHLWGRSCVRKVLGNYSYTGSLLLQTTFRENHITKKALPNRGELPMYHAENTYEAIVSMEDYQAVQAGVSPSSVKKYFAMIYGCPISEYIRRKRMEYACALLKDTDQSRADIAEQTGYAHQGKFGAAFKKCMGQSPLEYGVTAYGNRKQIQEKRDNERFIGRKGFG